MNPLFAAAAGSALGVALMLSSRASFRLVTPNGSAGLALAGVLLFARMGVAAAALLLYRLHARPAFEVFAAALAAGFVVTYSAELVRYARPSRTRTGVLASRRR
ncbi:MAG: hypothetical protein IBX62_03655 [Coriobacteriia bacterium]|nr:hypothetical protein [Coriobacteriia bacterium]